MSPDSPTLDSSATSRLPSPPVPPLVDALCAALNEQIERALGVSLDRSATSLAYVDHYLSLARKEERPEILTLLATQGGAYFGEVIRETIGAFWLGDGKDPRRLRLFITPQWLYLAPIDLAYEAIVCDNLDPEDERHPAGDVLDTAFHLQTRPGPDAAPSSKTDEQWVADRLEQSPLLSPQDYHSLTGRFETMQLILELLAAKRIAEGQDPKECTLQDYLHSLDPSELQTDG